MATKVGRLALIDISTDGGTVYNTIGRLVDGTVEMTTDEIDYSSHDSGGFREFEAGLTSGQITATFVYDEDETEQEALYSAFLARTTRDFRFVTESGAPNAAITAEGIVTSFSHSAGLDAMQMIDVTIRLSGTIARADQV